MANITVRCTVTGSLSNMAFSYTGSSPEVDAQSGNIDLSRVNGTAHINFDLIDELSDGSINFADGNPGTRDNFWVRPVPNKPDLMNSTHAQFADYNTPGKKKTKIKNKNDAGSGDFQYTIRFLGSDGKWYDNDPLIINRKQ